MPARSPLGRPSSLRRTPPLPARPPPPPPPAKLGELPSPPRLPAREEPQGSKLGLLADSRPKSR
eukprot:CAMPEP_0204346566 /NCGR_PEP_ID=MMETSP0469-20131031/27280_1 /ASSEMBLY_ACC=CAM_ASM_000384 /TAXON_ID=2969 /ORGANISM="Oxyrrhis marina" /LENGTH=63 /DNA_ID=CAMNT_0051332213 /DNA_START=166 /DNA_END=357 /DNA_ORIENTATION=+